MASQRICSIPGCGKRHKGHGLCGKHLMRLRTHGDPLKTAIAERGEPLRFIEELCARRVRPKECIEWPFGRGDGYGAVRRDGVSVGAHVEICQRVHGPKPSPQHETCHNCGRGIFGCVNPDHVYWGTHKQNMEDAAEHGSRTAPRGRELSWAKLTEGDVRTIRARCARGERQQAVADDYGVRQAYVSLIVARRKWAWVV